MGLRVLFTCPRFPTAGSPALWFAKAGALGEVLSLTRSRRAIGGQWSLHSGPLSLRCALFHNGREFHGWREMRRGGCAREPMRERRAGHWQAEVISRRANRSCTIQCSRNDALMLQMTKNDIDVLISEKSPISPFSYVIFQSYLNNPSALCLRHIVYLWQSSKTSKTSFPKLLSAKLRFSQGEISPSVSSVGACSSWDRSFRSLHRRSSNDWSCLRKPRLGKIHRFSFTLRMALSSV